MSSNLCLMARETLTMRLLGAAFLGLQLVGATLALACDEVWVCHDNEMYSDTAEMCVPKEQPST